LSKRFKREIRVLLILQDKLLDKDIVLYAIVRGVKGLEHIGLKIGSANEILNQVLKDKLMEEVRFVINVNSVEEEVKRFNIEFLKDRLREYSLILRKIHEELVNLITSNT